MSIIEKIKKNQDLASLPHIASKVLKLIQEKDTDINEIARVLEADPILTMKILRVANSPIFATRGEINNINHALMLLGMKRVSNIVVSVSIYSKFFISTNKNAAMIMEQFFVHSYLTAMVSKSLSLILKKNFEDNEFTGGLLHDIGKMAMLQIHPKEYSLVRQMIIQENLNELTAEKEVFGVNHVEVGLEMAKLWKLPEEIFRVIAFYKFTSQNDKLRDLVSIIGFSDSYAKTRTELVKDSDLANETPFEYGKVEAWRTLCEEIPKLKKINVKKLTKHLDITLVKAPKDLEMFK